MGIFSKLKQMKSDLSNRQMIARKEQIEKDTKMLQALEKEAAVLKKSSKLREDIASAKKSIARSKHPILARVADSVKSNLKKANQNRMAKTDNIFTNSSKDEDNIFTMKSKPPHWMR